MEEYGSSPLWRMRVVLDMVRAEDRTSVRGPDGTWADSDTLEMYQT